MRLLLLLHELGLTLVAHTLTVLGQCPRWLVFVEGVGHCMNTEGACTAPSAVGQNLAVPTWWGENVCPRLFACTYMCLCTCTPHLPTEPGLASRGCTSCSMRPRRPVLFLHAGPDLCHTQQPRLTSSAQHPSRSQLQAASRYPIQIAQHKVGAQLLATASLSNSITIGAWFNHIYAN